MVHNKEKLIEIGGVMHGRGPEMEREEMTHLSSRAKRGPLQRPCDIARREKRPHWIEVLRRLSLGLACRLRYGRGSG